MALSLMAMISSSTLAEFSIRFVMSDWSLSADQLTPTNSEQMPSTSRHLGTVEETRFIVVLFCAPHEHLLLEPDDEAILWRDKVLSGGGSKEGGKFPEDGRIGIGLGDPGAMYRFHPIVGIS
jgi:hypothetical protein